MPRTVAFFIYEGFQLLDAAGPVGAFEAAVEQNTPAPYRLTVIAPRAGRVRSSSGVEWVAEGMEDAGRIDTLIVSGGAGSRVWNTDKATLAFLARTARTARRVCSVCTGAYLLAGAGLLDGRRATTHWAFTQRLASACPAMIIDPDRIYVRDGKVWTSAGITAGIDMAMALIAEDLGEAASRAVAQELVVYHRRPGGQSQFSALLSLDAPDGRFAELISWMRANLAKPLTVEQLADRAGMSVRNFARAFREDVGATPAKAVERLRLDMARTRVETSDDSFDRIALICGFGDPDRMRRAFLRGFGHPPQTLRRNAA